MLTKTYSNSVPPIMNVPISKNEMKLITNFGDLVNIVNSVN